MRFSITHCFTLLALLINCDFLPLAYGEEILPKGVKKALQAFKMPETAVAFHVIPITLSPPQTQQFSWRAQSPMNPASTIKLLTTISAIDLLSPQYRWKTNVYATNPIEQGVLNGNLIWQGQGDPKFVPEELSKIMADLRQLGINEINGNLVFDRSAYSPSVKKTAPEDGEASRTYNVPPDALLYSFQTLSFKISNISGEPQITYTPRIAGLHIKNQLKSSKDSCADWTKSMKAEVHQVNPDEWNASFSGKFSINCPDTPWNIVALSSNDFLKQGIITAWEDAGGTWKKTPDALDGQVASHLKPLVSHQGILLADAVKDTNKYSNNVMARQIFLTIGLEKGNKPVTTDESSRIIKDWLKRSNLQFPELVLENGSGLSNIERISPQSMTSLLNFAAHSKNSEVIVNSLPIAGVDGTMKHRLLSRLKKLWEGNSSELAFHPDTTLPSTLQKSGAYMKTGTLQTVRAVAGYVVSKSGKVYAVSSIINHPNAAMGGSGVNDAVISWTLDDCPHD
jgi:D-alanyl-D-alanine carboxypeptidase/D-alanyl-D-alanine-endopeptidase (penicillin-binding protein 4)